ncbi:MAP7 domain-containing protein 2-like isoform X2 [Dreissena polymorpha]|uniref:Uncharacterized protein n=1 Tax=Dreissena polymorpha TaxID=45954 RepID=A0A9D4GNB6_DREPO|nr:MAP7 domain-containing protein 2-like isoform X2 [Dreissena polymorpha]KAH3818594.1 hypothetical protein DPMN_120316 [Dreissena polymorpha]
MTDPMAAVVGGIASAVVKTGAQIFGYGPKVCVSGHEHNSEKEAQACNDVETNRHQAAMQKEKMEAERIKAIEEQQIIKEKLRLEEKKLDLEAQKRKDELEAMREENRKQELQLEKEKLEAQKKKDEFETKRSKMCVIL